MKKLFILLLILASCTKQSLWVDNTYTKFEGIVEWYTLYDTLLIKRVVFWRQDSIYLPSDKARIRVQKPQWTYMCKTPLYDEHLELWYYLENGKPIHPKQ